MTYEMYDGSSFILPMVLKNDDETLRDISNATITAAAKSHSSAEVPAIISVVNATDGQFAVSFGAGVLAAGFNVLQVRVTDGGESRVVFEGNILVHPSHV